jgi:hypothetical protein
VVTLLTEMVPSDQHQRPSTAAIVVPKVVEAMGKYGNRPDHHLWCSEGDYGYLALGYEVEIASVV